MRIQPQKHNATALISILGSILTLLLLLRLISPLLSRLTAPITTRLFKPYTPNFKGVAGVEFYDLRNYNSNKNGWQQGDRILFCVPLRDAAEHLPMFFGHLNAMTYPHNLIDLSFLVSDSKDDTMGVLLKQLQEIQLQKDRSKRFGNIEIYEKDFGQVIGQSFSDRHGFAAQGPRRKLMAKARNWLGTVALKPYHSWVYWRDVDVETIPQTIMEDLMHHDKDVIVPNVWRPLPDWLGNIQPYDLNSWRESEGGLDVASVLEEDDVIVEGYPEYATWRRHLAYMRDPNGDPEEEMELDGIGGVSILSKAKVFRSGSHFPAFSFQKHAETEAFGKLSRRMNFEVVGLPHYVIWHIYEPSTEDLQHMAWMAEEEKRKIEAAKMKEFYKKIWEVGFEDVRDEWEDERRYILSNVELSEGAINHEVFVDWSDDGNGEPPSVRGNLGNVANREPKEKSQPEDKKLDMQEQENEEQGDLEQQQEEIIQEKLQGQQIVEMEKPVEVEVEELVEKVNPNQAPRDRNDVGVEGGELGVNGEAKEKNEELGSSNPKNKNLVAKPEPGIEKEVLVGVVNVEGLVDKAAEIDADAAIKNEIAKIKNNQGE